MGLELDYPIGDLEGAEYNPREISSEAIDRLCESLSKFGVVKPIIARGKTIVAGHQRTRALRKLGRFSAPVYLLDGKSTVYDEVRFNQLHNGTDLDGDRPVFVPPGQLGFSWVEPEDIRGDLRSSQAVVREQICALIGKYGPWGAAVATASGEVIHCHQYALSCIITAKPLLVFRIEDGLRDEFLSYSRFQYGQFSYRDTERKDFLQSFAQMMRLRNGKRTMRSILYETQVIPRLNSGEIGGKGLDFGSGQGDYAKLLRSQGYDFQDVELFRRLKAKDAINVRGIHKMIDRLCADLQSGGYDWVVCDSVFNSVNSLEAERAVATVMSAFCKSGGLVFYSGRPKLWLDKRAKATRSADKRRGIEFLDEDGFTALYRKGGWFFQKYHSPEDVAALGQSVGLEVIENVHRTETSWQAVGRKISQPEVETVEQAMRFEFEMMWPDGSRIGRSDDVIAAFKSSTGE